MRSWRYRCIAACAVAAFAGSGAGTAAADPAAPVCVGTGLLATQAPAAAAVPEAVGPVLLGPDRAGTTLASATEPAAGLSASDISLGVAGCVDPAGTPGGTTLSTGAWSILGGAIRGASLRADLVPRPGDGSNWWLRAKVEGLVVEGKQVTLEPGDETAVGNWGTLSPRPSTAALPAGAPPLVARRTAARAHPGPRRLSRRDDLPDRLGGRRSRAARHGGRRAAAGDHDHAHHAGHDHDHDHDPKVTPPAAPPAGTKPPAASPSGHAAARHTAAKRTAKHKAGKRSPKRTVPLVGQPLTVTPLLGPGARTFPVVGDVAWGDTYGAQRSDVPGGWHHGDDLFAPLGTPVVAVTNGVVFAVGWNRVGGWRLWLVDAEGNQYYYAHLSGYSALARNNHRVRRGQVLGFVGNTGDAITTWPHVHFEVHPNATLYLGYDGAVDPTHYLAAWTRLGRVASVPPPVPLPSSAPSGEGALKDFRALLAIRPLKVSPKVTANAAAHRRTAALAAPRGATALSLRAVPASRGGDGGWAILAGVVLLGGALVALHLTWRAGRA